MRPSDLALALVFSFLAVLLPGFALAQETTVDPVKVKAAAEEFDAGRRAYKQKDFPRAAAHFENAFRDAPSAQAIRMAVRARQEAGELARAATLCVRAQALYPDDRETVTLAQKILLQNTPKLQKVTVTCDPACTLTLDGKLVRDDAASSQVIFADPGEHELVAGWSKNRSVSRKIDGKEGTSTTVSMQAPSEEQEPAPVTPPPASSPAPVALPPAGSSKKSDVVPGRGAPPTLFWLAVGATAVVGGVTVWSGLDAQSNPGPDTVRAKCVGQGTSCPEYQDGESKERRTNYLLAGTAVGVVSTAVIGLFFTDWGATATSAHEPSASVAPTFDIHGVGLHASGRF